MTFRSAFERWLEFMASAIKPSTASVRRYNQARFFEWALANGVTVKNCKRKDIAAYMAAQQQNGVSNNTLRVRLTELRSFFEWAVAEGMADANPVETKHLPKLRREQVHKVPFTETEWRAAEGKALTGNYSDFWPAAMSIAWHTGLRISDVALLKWEAVQGETLVVYPKKRESVNQRLEIPIVAGLRECFAALFERRERTDGYILPVMATTYLGAKSKLQGEFRAICDEAGLPEHSFHSFRHAIASRLLNAGVDSMVVASITGQSLEVLKGYAHISREAKLKALNLTPVA